MTEKSKQSQVQSECREGWKGVRKIKREIKDNKDGDDGGERRLKANRRIMTNKDGT